MSGPARSAFFVYGERGGALAISAIFLVAFVAGCGDSSAGTDASTGTASSTGDASTSTSAGPTSASTTTGDATSLSGTMGVSMSGTTVDPSVGTSTTTPGTTGTSTTTTTDPGCQSPETECDGDCVNLNTDPDNCGGCGMACEDAELCADGVCVLDCPDGQTQCGQSCVDIGDDPAHCGGCDNACEDNNICEGGACVPLACVPGSEVACYNGPDGTQDVGTCKAGLQVCADDGMSFGPCEGEVVPTADDCGTPEDENCDGEVNEGCALESCLAYKEADPDAVDGEYDIDPDGDGPGPSFTVVCDMTLDGGGWTRFNWVLQDDYPPGDDPLGQVLADCKVNDPMCHGRIPPGVVASDLLVKDVTDNNYAMWSFNGSTISSAVLAALQNKTESCLTNVGAFQPYASTSVESYCGSGAEGGCDSFFYTSGSCKGVGNWGVHWDGDNAWCAAAFKMGATYAGCGNQGDQGFLNDCDCDDEHGELYYR